MSTIQVRIKDSTKKSAKKILDKLGIDMSSAIKIYLHQIVITNGIPFNLLTENGLAIDEENEINDAAKEAKQGKNIVRTTTWKETKEFLDSLK